MNLRSSVYCGLLILLFGAPAGADTYIVRPDGMGDYPTIQAAINAAQDYDIIELTSGVFTGSGNRDIIWGQNTITIRSQSGNPFSCTINCQGSLFDQHRAFIANDEQAYDSVLQNIRIVNGYAADGGAILLNEAIQIEGCIFSNNAATDDGGAIAMSWCTSPVSILDCVFTNNGAGDDGGALYNYNATANLTDSVFWHNMASSGDGGAIWCSGSSETTILTNCTLSGNTASNGSGICCDESMLTVDSCIIAFGVTGEAVYCSFTCTLDFSCTDIHGNAGGDWVDCIAGMEASNHNFSEDPQFCDETYGDLSLRPCSPCISRPQCGQVGAYGEGSCTRTWRVPIHAPTIQAGIDSASCGDTVFVEPGVYAEHDIVMKSGITLLGDPDDPHAVEINAQDLGRVIFATSVDDQTVIEGFRIMNGAVMGHGGGIYLYDSNPTIRNCVISDNTAGEPESGHVGGGIFAYSSSPVVENCVIWENWAEDNGGGVFCGQASLPVFDGCQFVTNSARTGGALYCVSEANADIDNCTFYGNETLYGGVISSLGNTDLLIDNTIISHSTRGPAVYCDMSSSITMNCCDVYGNEGGDWTGCIAGQLGTHGNFEANPRYCDIGEGDFSLMINSPCSPDSAPGGCGLIGALPVECGAPCCNPETYVCAILFDEACGEGGGIWHLDADGCDPLPCDVPTEPGVRVGGWLAPEPWHDWVSNYDDGGVMLQAIIPDHVGDISHVDFYFSLDGVDWDLIGEDEDGTEPPLNTTDTSVEREGCGWSTFFEIPPSTPPGLVYFKTAAYVENTGERIEKETTHDYDPAPPSMGQVNLRDFVVVDRDALGVPVESNGTNIDRIIIFREGMDVAYSKGIPGISQHSHSESHCAPAASAQCLKYFEDQGDYDITAELSDTELVSALAAFMSTNQKVEGTLPSHWVGGLSEWTRLHGDAYSVRYDIHYTCEEGYMAWNYKDWAAIRNELERCVDVLCGVFWQGGGGHVITMNSIYYPKLPSGNIVVGFKDPWTGDEETGEFNPLSGQILNMTGAGYGGEGQVGMSVFVTPEESDLDQGGPGTPIYDGLPPGGPPYEIEVELPYEGFWFLHVIIVNTQGNAHRNIRVIEYNESINVPADDDVQPFVFRLNRTIPNPFHASTEVSYTVPRVATVRIVIHDVTGRQVRTLVDGEVGPGVHRVVWDGKDNESRRVSGGIYYVKMTAPDFEKTGKITLVR